MSGFRHVRLGELMATKQGSVDPAKYRDETFELYSIPAYDNQVPEVTAGSSIGSTKQLVNPQDVLLSKIVPHIRRSWVVGSRGEHRQIASGEWIVFRHPDVFPPYLRRALMSDEFHKEFMKTVSGVGGSLLRARPAQVANIELPLPPLVEQRRIAAILDKADELRAKRRAALEQLDKLAQAIFVEMFGDALVNPREWQLGMLKELGKVTTGGTPSSNRDGMFGGSIPFITPGDLETNQSVRRSLTEAGGREVGTVRAGAALVCCIGATIGKMGIANERSAFNQQLNAVEWNSSLVDDRYGLVALQFLKPTIVRLGASTTLPILKKSSFERLSIPVPPKKLQTEFSNRLCRIEQLEAQQRSGLAASHSLFEALQHRAFQPEL